MTKAPEIEQSVPKWDHISETITMLYLAVCQIETSVCDSNKSVNHLTHSFTRLAEHNIEINNRIQALPDSPDLAVLKRETAATNTQMHDTVKESVEAFQFYDRISQRLDHVARGLEKMCEIVSDSNTRDNPETWKKIQEEVKASYSMESERIMFEHILRGASVKEALEIYHHHFDQFESDGSSESDDEVVLF